jgi:hypothetical protein
LIHFELVLYRERDGGKNIGIMGKVMSAKQAREVYVCSAVVNQLHSTTVQSAGAVTQHQDSGVTLKGLPQEPAAVAFVSLLQHLTKCACALQSLMKDLSQISLD